MTTVFCVMVGEERGRFPVVIDPRLSLGDLKKAIKVENAATIICEANELELFLARQGDEWLDDAGASAVTLDERGRPQAYELMNPSLSINSPKFLGENIHPGGEKVHVLVVVPVKPAISVEVLMPPVQQEFRPAESDVICCGFHGGSTDGSLGYNIDLSDKRNLSRSALTNKVISLLDKNHVLLVTSPPMTGKTSLSMLVGRDLASKSKEERKKVIVAMFSIFSIFDGNSFHEEFERTCSYEWSRVESLRKDGYIVYLVVDDTQLLYNNSESSPMKKSQEFWQLAKHVLSDSSSGFRVLMLASYRSGVQYALDAAPVDIPSEFVLGMEHLLFSSDEIAEYVKKWFAGYESLQDSATRFYDFLALLTGGHVGLCMTAIKELNEVYLSRVRNGGAPPSAQEWIRMLALGSMTDERYEQLFYCLKSSRAVVWLKMLKVEELDGLELLVNGTRSQSGSGSLDLFIQKRILVRIADKVDFSSPVMWRFFIQMRVRWIERTLRSPKTLQEMIGCVLKNMNYDNISPSWSDGIDPKKALQLEFYKASYRCTPRTFVTSIDVGALYGSDGFIDFTAREGNNFWGIELLFEGRKLGEHIQRFACDGLYPVLQLSDYCLLDFRRVSSMDDATKDAIDTDVSRCEKLYIVCYDAGLKQFSVWNSQCNWNFT